MRFIFVGIIYFVCNVSSAQTGSQVFCDSGGSGAIYASSSCEKNYELAQYPEINGYAKATAVATLGTLKTYAYAIGSNVSPSSISYAVANYYDSITVTAGSNLSSIAYIGVNTYMQSVGQLALDHPGNTDLANHTTLYNLTATSPINTFSVQGTNSAQTTNIPGQDNFVDQTAIPPVFRFAIVLGQPFSISANLSVSTEVRGSATAIIDASHSAYWGGIAYVEDEFGVPINYSLSSVSGTDWRQSFIPISTPAVPEPSTYAMLFAGLGGIGVAARRRARPRQ